MAPNAGPFGFPFPYPAVRQRSPSVSSTSSLTSMLGIERAGSASGGLGSGNGSNGGNGGGSNGGATSTTGGIVPMGWVPSSPRLISSGANGGGVAPMMISGGGAGSYSGSGMFPPASPRGMPQMLNLSGAQGDFQKMKISRQLDGDDMKD